MLYIMESDILTRVTNDTVFLKTPLSRSNERESNSLHSHNEHYES